MPDPTPNEDQTIQALAVDLAQQIRSRPDHDKVEYVAAIYRDGDTLRATALFSENRYFRADAAPAIAAAGGADRVVALIHNHPMEIVRRSGNQADDLKANRLPSENDWNSAREQFGDRADVSLFVLDPEDRLRRYENEDRQRWLREVKPNRFDRDGYNPDPSREIALPPLPRAPVATPQPGAEPSAGEGLHGQARAAVQRMQAAHGREWGEDGERMAACAAYVGERNGFQEIVSVAPNLRTQHHGAGELLCVHGRSANPDPHANLAALPMAEAASTPVAESLRRIDELRESQQREATPVQGQSQAPQLR